MGVAAQQPVVAVHSSLHLRFSFSFGVDSAKLSAVAVRPMYLLTVSSTRHRCITSSALSTVEICSELLEAHPSVEPSPVYPDCKWTQLV